MIFSRCWMNLEYFKNVWKMCPNSYLFKILPFCSPAWFVVVWYIIYLWSLDYRYQNLRFEISYRLRMYLSIKRLNSYCKTVLLCNLDSLLQNYFPVLLFSNTAVVVMYWFICLCIQSILTEYHLSTTFSKEKKNIFFPIFGNEAEILVQTSY